MSVTFFFVPQLFYRLSIQQDLFMIINQILGEWKKNRGNCVRPGAYWATGIQTVETFFIGASETGRLLLFREICIFFGKVSFSALFVLSFMEERIFQWIGKVSNKSPWHNFLLGIPSNVIEYVDEWWGGASTMSAKTFFLPRPDSWARKRTVGRFTCKPPTGSTLCWIGWETSC